MNELVDLTLGTINESYLDDSDHWKVPYTNYGSPRGLPNLLDAISRLEGVNRDQLIITSGASSAISSFLGSMSGQQICFIPKPYYPAYPALAKMFGHQVVYYDIDRSNVDTAWSQLEKLLDDHRDRSGVVLLNSPGNPLGNIITSDSAKRILAATRGTRYQVLVDATYDKVVLEPTETDWKPTLLDGGLVIVKSFSKRHMLPGLRVGYAMGDTVTISRMAGTHWALNLAPSTASQMLALKGLNSNTTDGDLRLRNNLLIARNQAIQGLQAFGLKNVSCPRAGVFLCISLEGLGMESERAVHILGTHNILASDGKAFGLGNSHLRLSFASTPISKVLNVFSTIGRVLTCTQT